MRLLCDANPMCYGSSAALLAILDGLHARRTAIASGVTAEILGRDSAVDEILEVDPKDPERLEPAIASRQFDAVLVVSNQSNVEVYTRRGLPLFFVDILYWMGRSKAQPVWRVAEQAFIENFPGVRERLARGETPGRPIVVGPLMRPRSRHSPSATGCTTLVNLGGARSRYIRPGIDSPFPRLVIRWLNALAPHLPAGEILVATGEEAVAAARIEPRSERIQLATMAQPDFLRALDAAEVYATIPGLNSVFEGLASGRPMLFLPPQNATQVLQLARYEDRGLVAPGLNLGALDPAFPRDPDTLDEATLTHEVLASLWRLDTSAALTERVVHHLLEQLRRWPETVAARERFLVDLGPPGGAVIAEHITRWWEQTCASRR